MPKKALLATNISELQSNPC